MIAAGAALAVVGIVLMGGTAPSKDLIFERAENDIDALPAEFASVGVSVPSGTTRHAGQFREVDYWVGRSATPGDSCLFVLPRYEDPEAACGAASVTIDLPDGTAAVYPIPNDADTGDGVLIGGIVLVE